MANVSIFNGVITVKSLADLNYNVLFENLKFQMVKSAILDAIRNTVSIEGLPNEFRGFLLTLEAQIIPMEYSAQTQEEVSAWFNDMITRIKAREALYAYCKINGGIHKLSVILTHLQERLLAQHFNQQFKQIVDQIYLKLKNQLEVEMIASMIRQAIQLYKSSAFWPIARIRVLQQQQLLAALESAQNTSSAMHVLYQHIDQVEEQHLAKSISPCCPFYQSRSRMAAYLSEAAQMIAKDLHYKKSTIESSIEHAIFQYLSDDIFYHNRNRLIKAKQLLSQIRSDQMLFSPEQSLQRKYKLRSTLDQYIRKIDEDFSATHFFSKYYCKKRSRLSLHLESLRAQLIEGKELSALELTTDIKAPIIHTLNQLMTNHAAHFNNELLQEMDALIQVIKDAQSPHAIETILMAHIKSYFEAGDKRAFLAHHFENSLLEWQRLGILPSSSEYKIFLQSMASQRQQIENDLRALLARVKHK